MKPSIASSVLLLLLLLLSLLSSLVSNAYGFIPNNNNDVTCTASAAYSMVDGNYYPGTPASVRDRIDIDGRPVMSVNEYPPPRSPLRPTTRMGYANMNMGTTPVFDRGQRSIYYGGNGLPTTMHRNALSGPEYPKEVYTAMPTMVMSSSSLAAENVRYPNDKYLTNWMVNYDNDDENANNRGTPVFNRQRIDVGSNRPVMSLGDYPSKPNNGAYEVNDYVNNVRNTRGSRVFDRRRSYGRRSKRPMMSLGRAYQNYNNNELRNHYQNRNNNDLRIPYQNYNNNELKRIPYGNTNSVYNRQRFDAKNRNSATHVGGDYSMPNNDFAYEVKRHMDNMHGRGSMAFRRERIHPGSYNGPITSLGYHSQYYQNYYYDYDDLRKPYNGGINRGTPVFNRERIDTGSNKPVMSLGN